MICKIRFGLLDDPVFGLVKYLLKKIMVPLGKGLKALEPTPFRSEKKRKKRTNTPGTGFFNFSRSCVGAFAAFAVVVVVAAVVVVAVVGPSIVLQKRVVFDIKSFGWDGD